MRMIDSPNIVANYIKLTLEKHKLLNTNNLDPKYEFYISNMTKNFQKISKKFFGNKIELELKTL